MPQTFLKTRKITGDPGTETVQNCEHKCSVNAAQHSNTGKCSKNFFKTRKALGRSITGDSASGTVKMLMPQSIKTLANAPNISQNKKDYW